MMSAANGHRAADRGHRPRLAAVLVAAFAVGMVAALVGLPREHSALPAIARRALVVAIPHWHITEPVNEVVYGTRGFDTFGETFLLLAAVVSVVLLTRRREPRQGEAGEEAAGAREERAIDPSTSAADRWEHLARLAEHAEEGGVREGRPLTPDADPLGTPAPELAEAMTVVVRTAARVAAPVLAIMGTYVVAWGYSPGGGFPAGAVMLGVALLLYAGFGPARVEPFVRQSRVELVEVVGAAVVVAIAILGLVLRGAVFANFLPLARNPQTILSGGIVQAFSGSELIEVSTGLILTVFALLGMRHDWAPDEEGGE
jgi:multicomponent Na+:H+ antiporter subunit B